MSIKNIESIHAMLDKNINSVNSSLSYDRIVDGLILLGEKILAEDGNENIWYIGEHCYSSLDDMIIGAYWHFSECHKGQYSKEYIALSVLGLIFSPNYEIVDKDNIVYCTLNDLAEV